VAAFNVIMLEQLEGVLAGAERAGRPVIVQISENAVRFHQGQLRPLAAAAAEAAAGCPVEVALHLDHVTDPALLHQGAEAGFSSVMFDAGALPYQQNLAETTAAARWAHSAGLWIEAELGYIGGKPAIDGAGPTDLPAAGAHATGVRTDPRQAVSFVEQTGVDALAVAVGSSHAMTSQTAMLDHQLIGQLATAIEIPLVLHGSSGVPDQQLQQAVTAGMRKINVGTALNLAYTTAIRRRLAGEAELVDPRSYLADARDAVAEAVARLLLVIDAGTGRG
jgi:fructose-bisphosphate aldolase class II